MRKGNARVDRGRHSRNACAIVPHVNDAYEAALKELVDAAREREACAQSHFAACRDAGTDFAARRHLADAFERQHARLLSRERWSWAALRVSAQ